MPRTSLSLQNVIDIYKILALRLYRHRYLCDSHGLFPLIGQKKSIQSSTPIIRSIGHISSNPTKNAALKSSQSIVTLFSPLTNLVYQEQHSACPQNCSFRNTTTDKIIASTPLVASQRNSKD